MALAPPSARLLGAAALGSVLVLGSAAHASPSAPTRFGECAKQTLRLSGPPSVRSGDAATLRVVLRSSGAPAPRARIRAEGIPGSIEVDRSGRARIQITGTGKRRLEAFRGPACSNQIAIRIRE
ncbi:MAG: hypothetical protein ACT4QG_13185 [Sporichthyaceae bacterium]